MILPSTKQPLPWEKNPAYDYAGPMPDMLVGDRFVVAVPLSERSGGGYDVQVISCDETGFNKYGESWGDWAWSDVEYYIPLDGKRNLSKEQQ